MFPWILLGKLVVGYFRIKEQNKPTSPISGPDQNNTKMLKIPILSRLSFNDYISLAVALGLLVAERVIRIFMLFVPHSLIEHLRHNLIRYSRYKVLNLIT